MAIVSFFVRGYTLIAMLLFALLFPEKSARHIAGIGFLLGMIRVLWVLSGEGDLE